MVEQLLFVYFILYLTFIPFSQIMAQSFAVGGCPSTSLFCPTTLVRKPVRYGINHNNLHKCCCCHPNHVAFSTSYLKSFYSNIITFVILHFLLNTSTSSSHKFSIDRSKYCTRTGCVVARFDHQCLWLNTTIGHNNHRTFIVFLVSHLLLCTATLIMLIK